MDHKKAIISRIIKRISLFLFLLFFINSVNGAITDNLIAYYKLNESTPIHDASGNQVDAVNFGADFVTGGGKFDNYFNFTSTDKMNLSGNFKSAYNGLSWGGHFKTNAVLGSAGFAIDGHNGANQGFFLRFDAGNVVDCVIATGGAERSAASTYTTGVWESFACVFNQSSIAIYKNGNYVTSTAATGGMNKNTGSVCLGSYCTANLNYGGGMDEIFIYNRSISDDEVKSLNNSQVTFGGSPAVQGDSLSVTLDKNTTDSGSIWFNWSTVGNYSYSLVYRAGSLVYNGSTKSFNNTGLANNTAYLFNLTAFYNNSLSNSTTFTITTTQSIPVVPSPSMPLPSFSLTSNISNFNGFNLSSAFSQISIKVNGTLNYNFFLGNFSAYYDFDNQTFHLADKNQLKNLSNSSTSNVFYTSSGKYGGGLNLTNGGGLNTTNDLIGDNNFGVCFWLNTNTYGPTTSSMIINKVRNSDKTSRFQILINNTHGLVVVNDPYNQQTLSNANLTLNGWAHYCVSRTIYQILGDNYAFIDLYRNGSLISRVDQSYFITGVATHTEIGKNPQNLNQNFTGLIDDLIFYNTNLSAALVSQIYNNTAPRFTCEIYRNNTLVSQATNLIINQTHILNASLGSLEGGFSYNVACNDGYKGSNAQSSIFVDTVNPQLDLLNTLFNNQIFKRNISVFQFSAQATDTNLYAVNYSISKLNADTTLNQTLNVTFIENINTTVYSNTFIFTNYSNGAYLFKGTVWDSHTSNKIDNYNIVNLIDGKEIGGVIITSPDLNTFALEKKSDRYSFDMKFKKVNPEIYIEAPDLQYLPKSNYRGHFVSFSLNKWVDFEDNALSMPIIEKVAPHKFKVTFTNGKKDFYFNSIGDLNRVDYSYYFNITDSVYIYAFDFLTNATINEFSAIIYNGVTQTYNTTTGVIITNLTGNITVNLSASSFITQTYRGLNFSPGNVFNLSLNASAAFTVFVRDQLTRDLITPSPVYLEFIGANSSNYSTTTGYKYITNLAPGDYIIRYTSSGYTSEFYYFTLLNGTNIQFTIYMLPETANGNSNITATVVDELQNPVTDAYIYVQRYDLNTNSYLTVSISKTNFEGKTVLHLTKNTEFYKFLIYYQDVLRLTVDPTYIYEDDINFQINLNDVIAGNYYTSEGIDYALDFNTATLNFRFQFSDPSLTMTSGTLKVYNVSNGFQDLVTSTTVNGVSGTILINAANVSGRTYRADAYANINGVDYYINTIYYTFPASAPLTTDKSMLFYLSLLTILFAGLAFFDIKLAIIIAPLPWLFASLVNWIPIPFYVMLPIEIMGIIIVFLISRN